MDLNAHLINLFLWLHALAAMQLLVIIIVEELLGMHSSRGKINSQMFGLNLTSNSEGTFKTFEIINQLYLWCPKIKRGWPRTATKQLQPFSKLEPRTIRRVSSLCRRPCFKKLVAMLIFSVSQGLHPSTITLPHIRSNVRGWLGLGPAKFRPNLEKMGKWQSQATIHPDQPGRSRHRFHSHFHGWCLTPVIEPPRWFLHSAVAAKEGDLHHSEVDVALNLDLFDLVVDLGLGSPTHSGPPGFPLESLQQLSAWSASGHGSLGLLDPACPHHHKWTRSSKMLPDLALQPWMSWDLFHHSQLFRYCLQLHCFSSLVP